MPLPIIPAAILYIIAALIGAGSWELAKKLKGWLKMTPRERLEAKEEALQVLLKKTEEEKVKAEAAEAKAPKRAKSKA